MRLPFVIKVNFVAIYLFIIKFIHKHKRKGKVMGLFKRLFRCKQIPFVVPQVGTRTALLFSINDYPGTQNDLNGCLTDQKEMRHLIEGTFPSFIIKPFIDSMVTMEEFISEIIKHIGYLKAGDFLLVHYSGHGTQVYDVHGDEEDGYDEALYLMDGPVIDDDIGFALKKIPEGATVFFMLDSCFSGGGMKKYHTCKPRFIPHPDYPEMRRKKRIRIPREEMRYLVMSGCQEDQTSADAYINGKYCGAFTYYAIQAFAPSLTYRQWLDRIRKFIPCKSYPQNPTLEGKADLFDKVIFT